MKPKHLKNRSEGMLVGENRLVFERMENPHEMLTRKSADRQKTEAQKEKTEKAFETTAESAKRTIRAYNEKYTKSDFWTPDYKYFGTNADDQKKRDENPQEQPIELKGKELKEIQAQVKLLLASKIGTDPKFKDQLADLRTIDQWLVKWDKETGEKEAKEKQYAGYRATRSQERYALVGEMEKGKTELLENDGYKAALAEVKNAIKGLLPNPAYEKFFKKGGREDMRMLEENQNLFMAILGQQTENFKPGVPLLGSKFGNNEQQNKESFPFVYHEWAENRKVADKETLAKLAEVDTLNRLAGTRLDDENTPGNTDFANAIEKLIPLKAGPNNTQVSLVRNRVLDYAKNNRAVKGSTRYLAYAKELEAMKGDISAKVTELRKLNQTKEIEQLEELSEKLDPCRDAALKAVEYYRLVDEKGEPGAAFTLDNLQKAGMEHWLLKTLLRQYLKAQEIVDEGYGKFGGNSKALLHPAVRQAMVAMVFREGVSAYESTKLDAGGNPIEEYKESNADQYRWMFAELAQSPYFNALDQGRYLDAGQQEFLLLARYANLAIIKRGFLEEKVRQMQAVQKKIAANAKDPTIKTDLGEIGKTIDGAPAGTPLDENNLANVISREIGVTGNLLSFQMDAQNIIRTKPNESEKTEDFKDRMQKLIQGALSGVKSGNLAQTLGTNAAAVTGFENYIQSVDKMVHMQEFEPASLQDRLEIMGIDPLGFFNSFNRYRQEHPELDLNVENWDRYLMKEGNVGILVNMFEATLGDSKIQGGKEDFIQTLRTLHGRYPLEIQPGTQDAQAAAIKTYELLKNEIRQRQKIDDTHTQIQKELKSRLSGMNFVDKIPETAKSIIDMVIGPGQSLTNRAAGAAMLVVAWKMLKSAWKGETKFGKISRYVGLAVAGELTLKNVFGEGILDKLKVTGIADAMQGTHESVLIERGKTMDITKEQHSRALVELNKVPFAEVLNWYRNSTPDGQPLSGGKDLFPKSISVAKIVKGMNLKEKDSKVEARRIVKRTVENFLEYVGSKQRRGADTGFQALEERWVKALTDKNFDLSKTEGTEVELQKILLDPYRSNPKSLTWEAVMRAEVLPEDVDRVTKNGFLNTLASNAETAAVTVAEVTREQLAKGGDLAKRYYQSLGARYGRVIPETAEQGWNFLEDKKNEIKMWWGTSQDAVRIRNLGGDMWQIVKTGATLPYAVTLHATEWTAGGLKDFINQLNKRRQEWLDIKRDATFDLRVLDANGNPIDIQTDPSPEAEAARSRLGRLAELHGFDWFGRKEIENDFIQVKNVTNRQKEARGMLAAPDLFTNPDARITMHFEEGYINFIGIGKKGDAAEAYREGVSNLVRYLKANDGNGQPRTNLINNTIPEGQALIEALNTNDEEKIRDTVESYIERFGAMETDFNGQLLFLHFPFPTASTAQTWTQQVLTWNKKTKTGTAMPVTYPVKYRGRYEAKAQGKEYPRFDLYKRSIRFSVMDDPVTTGYIEPWPKKGWIKGPLVEQYMKEFNIWSPAEAKDVVGMALQNVDGKWIQIDRGENAGEALLRIAVRNKENIMEHYRTERSYPKCVAWLKDTKYAAAGAEKAFSEVHNFLEEYFVAPDVDIRLRQAYGQLFGGSDGFRQAYRSFMMQRMSEKFRDENRKGVAYKITVKDVNDFSGEFIDKHASVLEATFDRAMNVVGMANSLLNGLFQNKHWTIPGTGAKRKKP